MLFKNKNMRIVVLGINNLALDFAEKASKKYSVVILGNKYNKKVKNMDLIFVLVENELTKAFKDSDMKKANYFISLTLNDEYNLFAANLAKVYGVEKSFALVHSTSYLKITNTNIDYIINPYHLVINRLNHLLEEKRFKTINNFIPGKADICKIIIQNNDRFSYSSIDKININEGKIFAVEKNNKLLTARDDLTIYPDDIIYVLYKKEVFAKVLKKFSIYKKRKLFINGINGLGKAVIKSWHNLFSEIIIIDPNLDKCHHLAEKTNNSLILNGEGTDINLLKEEGLNNNSVFISLSSDSLHNIISSFSAREIGCKIVVSILYNNKYINTAKLLNLNNILSMPNIITKDLLNNIISRKQYNGPQKKNGFYLIKVKIKDYLDNKKISSINLPEEIVPAFIERDKKLIIIDKDIKFNKKDIIYIISRSKYIKNLEKYFYLHK